MNFDNNVNQWIFVYQCRVFIKSHLFWLNNIACRISSHGHASKKSQACILHTCTFFCCTKPSNSKLKMNARCYIRCENIAEKLHVCINIHYNPSQQIWNFKSFPWRFAEIFVMKIYKSNILFSNKWAFCKQEVNVWQIFKSIIKMKLHNSHKRLLRICDNNVHVQYIHVHLLTVFKLNATEA